MSGIGWPSREPEKAAWRVAAVAHVGALQAKGMRRGLAVTLTAMRFGVSRSSVWRWLREVEGLNERYWPQTLTFQRSRKRERTAA